MSDAEAIITNVLLLLYVVEVVAATAAIIGVYRFYREDGGRASLIWRALLVMQGIIVVSAVLTLPIGIAALFGLPRLPFTGAAVILLTMAQLGAIIVYYFLFRHIRNSGPLK